MKIIVYAQGDFAKYVTIEKNTFYIKSTDAEIPFSYKIDLPAGMKPGKNDIEIVVMELSTPESGGQDTTVTSVLSVIQRITINVPYGGKYAEGFFSISEGNVNDTITFMTNIINRGTDTLKDIDGYVIIKGPTNAEITTIEADKIHNLESRQSEKMSIDWTANVNPGTYYAEFYINYDGQQLVLTKTFNVGNQNIDIRKISVDTFKIGSIAKIDVDLLNKWNQPVDNIYAEMVIMDDKGNSVSTLRTVPVTINPMSTGMVTGYWDTRDVTVGNYDIKVVIHTGEKTFEKIFKTVVGIDSITTTDVSTAGQVISSGGKGGTVSILVVLVIILVAINLGWLIYFKFLKKKDNDR